MAFVDEGTKSDANQEGAIERKTNNTINKTENLQFFTAHVLSRTF